MEAQHACRCNSSQLPGHSLAAVGGTNRTPHAVAELRPSVVLGAERSCFKFALPTQLPAHDLIPVLSPARYNGKRPLSPLRWRRWRSGSLLARLRWGPAA